MEDFSITLRPLTSADTDFMVRLVSDPAVTEYLPDMITSHGMMESWIHSLRDSDHEYIVQHDGTEIGECSLTVADDHTAEIGFMLLPQFWRRGFGTEVVQQLLEKADQLQVTEVTATTDANNSAAVELLTKMGFQKQNIGWMASLSEDGEVMSQPQTIVSFSRKMNPRVSMV